MLIEEMISTGSLEDLEKIERLIQAEKNKRRQQVFSEEKNKVLTALQSFKDKFPCGSIEILIDYPECGVEKWYNILDYIGELDFDF